jgi:hypothetical protein
MATVRVGLVGCGFVAELHMHAYKRVYGIDAQVTAVAARGDHVLDFARKHQIPTAHRDFQALLAERDIDVMPVIARPKRGGGSHCRTCDNPVLNGACLFEERNTNCRFLPRCTPYGRFVPILFSNESRGGHSDPERLSPPLGACVLCVLDGT